MYSTKKQEITVIHKIVETLGVLKWGSSKN